MIRTPEGFEIALDLALHDEAIVHLFVRDALVQRAQAPAPLPWSAYRSLGLEPVRVQPVGRLAGLDHLAVALADDLAPERLPEGWRAGGLRSWFGVLDDRSMAIAMRAVQALEWDRTHRFCGACGTPTEQAASERAKRCPACGLTVYPRISPAMMVLVRRGRELLLGRGLNFPPGRYSALAGFLEAGETIEEAVAREVREEVGIEVQHLRYFGSQSWPFPNSLMIAFQAEYAGGDMRANPEELADAQWFSLDALPQLPPRLSIARALIDATVAELRATPPRTPQAPPAGEPAAAAGAPEDAGLTELLARFANAVAARDAPGFGALFTPDACYDDGFFGEHHGREAIAAMLERFHDGGEAFCWQFLEPLRLGDLAYARYCFSYRSREPESAGELVVFEGMSRLRLHEGLIRHYGEVFDRGVAFAQLGYATPRIRKLLDRYATSLRSGPLVEQHLAHRGALGR
jgi:NAD+ diphosphatase